MKGCIFIVCFLVLINRSLVGFFGSSHGLCQRDPLSPLLFLLVMEVLSRLVERTKEGDFHRGFQASHNGGLHISHLCLLMILFFFAILFYDASREQLLYSDGVDIL